MLVILPCVRIIVRNFSSSIPLMTTLKARPASLSSSWEDVKKHAGSLALTYVAMVALSTVAGVVFYILFAIFFMIAGGAYADYSFGVGAFFGLLGSLPLYAMVALLGVLFTAIPALYFESGEPIKFGDALKVLKSNPSRYLLAGVFFTLVSTVGLFLCLLPGLAIFQTIPVYVNNIFNTNKTILESFSSSFSSVFKGSGWSFVGVQILAVIALQFISLCTCGVGVFVALPLVCFYMQNLAYNKGLVV